jgi:hypothetical protein
MNQKQSIDYIQRRSLLSSKIPLHGLAKNGRPSITDLVLFEKQRREKLLLEQESAPPSEKLSPLRYVKSVEIAGNAKNNGPNSEKPLIKAGIDQTKSQTVLPRA